MTRFAVYFSAVLFPCVAMAQSPAPGLATPGSATSVSATSGSATSVSADSQPGVTTTASPELIAFQKIEDTWSAAVNQRDQYALELVMSPLFVDVSAAGDITTRNQQVADLLTGEDKTVHLEQRVVAVRMLGDTAVANGTYVLHHKVGSAQVDEKGVFTQVFERQHGRWMCINSQRTLLRGDATGKGKKKSNAELPFHFPFFSKSDNKKP